MRRVKEVLSVVLTVSFLLGGFTAAGGVALKELGALSDYQLAGGGCLIAAGSIMTIVGYGLGREAGGRNLQVADGIGEEAEAVLMFGPVLLVGGIILTYLAIW